MRKQKYHEIYEACVGFSEIFVVVRFFQKKVLILFFDKARSEKGISISWLLIHMYTDIYMSLYIGYICF